jgi:hypothetical protein
MQARMRQMSLFAVVAVALVVVLGGTALVQSTNSEVGIWKLNVAKSKFSLGTALNSGTTQIEAADAGIKVTVDTVGADGTVRHWEFTANYDGKENPITGNSPFGNPLTGNSPFGDVVALARTRVDANTTRTVYKKGGKVMVTQTAVMSSDGKTRTVTTKGANALGQTFDNVNFYEKQ